jgi:hypothetical protein
MTLPTTCDEILSAAIESLAASSASRLPLLRALAPRARLDVMISGGTARLLHRDWPGRWAFKSEEEATLRCVAVLGRL